MRTGTLVVQNLIRGLLPFAFPQSESIIVIVGRKRAILIFKFIPRFFSPHRAPLKSEFDSILVNPTIPSNHLQSILFFVTRVTSFPSCSFYLQLFQDLFTRYSFFPQRESVLRIRRTAADVRARASGSPRSPG